MTQLVIMPAGHVATYTESDTGWEQVTTEPVNLLGALIRTDGLNDPTIGIYTGTSGDYTVRLPQTEFEADYKGFNGAMLTFRLPCLAGLLLYSASSGAFTVSLYFSRHPI